MTTLNNDHNKLFYVDCDSWLSMKSINTAGAPFTNMD